MEQMTTIEFITTNGPAAMYKINLQVEPTLSLLLVVQLLLPAFQSVEDHAISHFRLQGLKDPVNNSSSAPALFQLS